MGLPDTASRSAYPHISVFAGPVYLTTPNAQQLRHVHQPWNTHTFPVPTVRAIPTHTPVASIPNIPTRTPVAPRPGTPTGSCEHILLPADSQYSRIPTPSSLCLPAEAAATGTGRQHRGELQRPAGISTAESSAPDGLQHHGELRVPPPTLGAWGSHPERGGGVRLSPR